MRAIHVFGAHARRIQFRGAARRESQRLARPPLNMCSIRASGAPARNLHNFTRSNTRVPRGVFWKTRAADLVIQPRLLQAPPRGEYAAPA